MRIRQNDKAGEQITREDAELLAGLTATVTDSDESADADGIPQAVSGGVMAEDAAAPDIAADGSDAIEGYRRQIGELQEKLREAEAERAAKERELECLGLLESAGLPAELAPLVIASGEEVSAAVSLIRDAVMARVEAEVSARCRTVPPLSGGKTPMTREELIRTPVAELQRLRDAGMMG